MGEDQLINIDANDILNDVPVEATTTEEPSAPETKEPVEEPAEVETESEPADADTEETPTDEEPKPRSAEARKEQLQTEIRSLVNQRNDIRNEVARLNSQAYQVPTAEQLLAQDDTGVMSPEMARINAMEQRTQMAEYNTYVADLNANVNIEAMQVLADFPVFDKTAPEYDAALAQRAEQTWLKAAAIQQDPNTGLITQANILPYEIYKAFAETHSSGAKTGQVQGQRATEKMLAAADTPSSAAPKPAKEDPFLIGLTSGLKR